MASEIKRSRGRPEVPEAFRRVDVGARLPAWQKEWLATRPESVGALLEQALTGFFKLKTPK